MAEDITHAIENAERIIYEFEPRSVERYPDPDLVMGRALDGTLLEIFTIGLEDWETPIVFHAMPARSTFLN